MRKTYFCNACRIFFLLVILLTGGGFGINANANSTFFYKVTAKASPTGTGKVYATTDETTPSDDQYAESVNIDHSNDGVSTSTPTVYLYAKPNEGYLFNNWTDASNNIVSTEQIYSPKFTISSKTKGSPSTFDYTANFMSVKTRMHCQKVFISLTARSLQSRK